MASETARRMVAFSASTAMILAACRDRPERRLVIQLSAGGFAGTMFLGGARRWFGGRSFWNTLSLTQAGIVGSVLPCLYSSRVVLSRTRLSRDFDELWPALRDSEHKPYVHTFLYTTLGSACVSTLCGFQPTAMMPYLVTGCMVVHFLFDLIGQTLLGMYRKQALKLHFPHIAEELEDELEVVHVSLPYITGADKQIKSSLTVMEEIEDAQGALQQEIELVQALQEEIFRMREKLELDEDMVI